MKLLFGAHIRCEKCNAPMDDAFASMNQDAEDHWCNSCNDFRGGYVAVPEDLY
jgi:hypothetical protein